MPGVGKHVDIHVPRHVQTQGTQTCLDMTKRLSTRTLTSMAEMTREANRLARLEAQGICTHQGVQGRGDGKGPLPGGFYREEQRDIPWVT